MYATHEPRPNTDQNPPRGRTSDGCRPVAPPTKEQIGTYRLAAELVARAIAIYDQVRPLVREVDHLDGLLKVTPAAEELFEQIEGVLFLVDEELHEFVALSRSKALTPLRLEIAREIEPESTRHPGDGNI